VAVLGGGIGGLSAAHELAERGFSVQVYEKDGERFGGKARSVWVPGSGVDGRQDLPGEHGFRFFPGFYRHLPDTMQRIPLANGNRTVADNLVPTSRGQLARKGEGPLEIPLSLPRNLADLRQAMRALAECRRLGIGDRELAFYFGRLLVLLTSCKKRREREWEHVAWWDFIDAPRRSEKYKTFFAIGATRTLVAMRAEESSTRTAGYTLLQLLFNTIGYGHHADRVLNGPTNQAWIDPWVAYLDGLGVRMHLGVSITGFEYDGHRVFRVRAECDGKPMDISADYFVAAMPIEMTRKLVDVKLAATVPTLVGLLHLKTAWMSGLQLYLDRDPPIVPGHTIYAQSAWALTTISQPQFWPDFDLARCGDGTVKGILSVDISDWDTPGTETTDRPAKECTPEQIVTEVWAQIRAHLCVGGVDLLEGARIVNWFLDPSLHFGASGKVRNAEPLLLNTIGTLQYRPEAGTEVPNLMLAADYVRGYTDLATMENANEAARRAVNAIIAASGAKLPRCGVWPLKEPMLLVPARAVDRVLFELGLSHVVVSGSRINNDPSSIPPYGWLGWVRTMRGLVRSRKPLRAWGGTAPGWREFRFDDAGESRFWAIRVSGDSYTVHFGRVGHKGETFTKQFGSAWEARESAAALVEGQLKEGYSRWVAARRR
jgi:uncharacterized protein with NAD-binding domain and iron-sulfur cluster/predicted DNA-binding WGR domain protein